LPDELKKYAYSGMVQPNSKDTLIHLSECLIIDMDELSSLTRRENNDVKELITKAKIKIRRPYGRNPENLPRRASFIGSINEDEFLTDLTGNRRFLCFKVMSIDYNDTINHFGVFSQAFELYKSGFKFYFDGKEIDKLNARNEKFRQKSPIEEIVMSRYKPATDIKEARYYLNSAELLTKLNDESKVQMSTTNHIQLGKVLKSLGFMKVKKKGSYKYAVDIINNSNSGQRDSPLQIAS
jgi:predicted P-loop ATPase